MTVRYRYDITCPLYKKILGTIQINSSKGIPHTDPTLVDLRFKCKRCKKFHWMKPEKPEPKLRKVTEQDIVKNSNLIMSDIFARMAKIDTLGDRK